MKKEPLKVSKNLHKQLDSLLKLRGNNINSILLDHAETKLISSATKWYGNGWEILNELTLDEMATALYVGYELEPSPEEKALDYYNHLQNGHKHIIRMFLKIAEIDFEGLDNDDLFES